MALQNHRREALLVSAERTNFGTGLRNWWCRSNLKIGDLILLIFSMGIDVTEAQSQSVTCLQSIISNIVTQASDNHYRLNIVDRTSTMNLYNNIPEIVISNI
jgi:hypothetical protein